MTEINKNKVCFIGGDERQRYAARKLSKYIFVNTFGDAFKGLEGEKIVNSESPNKAMYEVSAVILPLPAASSEKEILFTSLIEGIEKSQGVTRIYGGNFSPYMRGILENKNIKFTDYYKDECFTLKNAYLTAEGAVNLAMNNSKRSLNTMNCAVIGYGRIGKLLASLLRAFNSRVTIFARRGESLADAENNGLQTNKILPNGILPYDIRGKYDMIFNTVPERIISEEALLSLDSETMLIELASTPGGFDPDIADQCLSHNINGRGLPGKYAPETAGEILAETLVKYLKEEGIL